MEIPPDLWLSWSSAHLIHCDDVLGILLQLDLKVLHFDQGSSGVKEDSLACRNLLEMTSYITYRGLSPGYCNSGLETLYSVTMQEDMR